MSFSGLRRYNVWLWDSEKGIVSSDVEFPVKRAKNFEEQDQTIVVEPQVDELDYISVDLAKAYQPEKRFPRVFLDELNANNVDVADNIPGIFPTCSFPPIRNYISDLGLVWHCQSLQRLQDEQAEALKKSSFLSAFSTYVVDLLTDFPGRYCPFIISDLSVLASYMAAKESFPHLLSGTPFTNEQAISSPQADFWKVA